MFIIDYQLFYYFTPFFFQKKTISNLVFNILLTILLLVFDILTVGNPSLRYELIEDVAAREAEIAKGLDALSEKGAQNKPILDDNLQRELFKEATVMKVDVHQV